MVILPRYVNAFVLQLPEKQEIQLREQIKGFYTREANLRKNVLLHIGLLVICLDDNKTAQMLQFLHNWNPEFPRIEISIGQLEKIGIDYIGFSVDSPLLLPIHNQILEKVKHITAGCYDTKYLSQPLRGKQKEYLEEYGYHRVKEYFEPHITIGKYVDQATRDREFESAPKLSGKLTFTELVFDRADIKTDRPVGAKLEVLSEVLWRSPLR